MWHSEGWFTSGAHVRCNSACMVQMKSKCAIFEPFADEVKRLERERKTVCDDLATTLSIFMTLCLCIAV